MPGAESLVDLDTPTFSITTTAMANSNTNAVDWLFGNPIRSQLMQSMTAIADANSGLLVQNNNWQQASGGSGILRTMNQAISDAGKLVEKNKVAATWIMAVLGVVVVGKVLQGGKGRRR